MILNEDQFDDLTYMREVHRLSTALLPTSDLTYWSRLTGMMRGEWGKIAMVEGFFVSVAAVMIAATDGFSDPDSMTLVAFFALMCPTALLSIAGFDYTATKSDRKTSMRVLNDHPQLTKYATAYLNMVDSGTDFDYHALNSEYLTARRSIIFSHDSEAKAVAVRNVNLSDPTYMKPINAGTSSSPQDVVRNTQTA